MNASKLFSLSAATVIASVSISLLTPNEARADDPLNVIGALDGLEVGPVCAAAGATWNDGVEPPYYGCVACVVELCTFHAELASGVADFYTTLAACEATAMPFCNPLEDAFPDGRTVPDPVTDPVTVPIVITIPEPAPVPGSGWEDDWIPSTTTVVSVGTTAGTLAAGAGLIYWIARAAPKAGPAAIGATALVGLAVLPGYAAAEGVEYLYNFDYDINGGLGNSVLNPPSPTSYGSNCRTETSVLGTKIICDDTFPMQPLPPPGDPEGEESVSVAE